MWEGREDHNHGEGICNLLIEKSGDRGKGEVADCMAALFCISFHLFRFSPIPAWVYLGGKTTVVVPFQRIFPPGSQA